MPIHEYLLPTGERVERIYLAGETVPQSIEVGGITAPKVVSSAVIKFKGSFSGATMGKHIVHVDDGTVIEPGREKDTLRNKQQRQDDRDNHRKAHIEKSLSEYDL